MKSRIIFSFSLALLLPAAVYAQRVPTNSVSQDQAIKIASHLRAGMSQAQVEKSVDQKYGLQSGGNVGSPISGWTRSYLLSNDSSLDLRFDPKGHGTNFVLSDASIRKQTGEKVVSITLTNAP
jgi:hypothetical protein